MTEPEPTTPEPGLPEDMASALESIAACPYCGGQHARACPRVKKLTYHPGGEIAGVEYWPHGRWPDDHIIWPDTE